MEETWYYSGGPTPVPPGPDGEDIGNSLRWRANNNQLIAPVRSTGAIDWTWSAWVKRGNVSTGVNLWTPVVGNSGTSPSIISSYGLRFQLDNTQNIGYQTGEFTITGPNSGDRLFRDPTAWYHVVCQCRTSNNSMIIWVNGERVADGPIDNDTAVSFANNMRFDQATNSINNTTQFTLADAYLMQDLRTADDFGRTNDVGVWVPRETNFTAANYGANGFHLTFAPDTITTTGGVTTIADQAPIGGAGTGHENPNNFTATGFELVDDDSVDFDLLTDSPSQNFSILNSVTPLKTGGTTYADAGLNVTNSSTTAVQSVPGTVEIPETGRWHFEYTYLTPASYPFPGINRLPADRNDGTWFGGSLNVGAFRSTFSNFGVSDGNIGNAEQIEANDTFAFSIDRDADPQTCRIQRIGSQTAERTVNMNYQGRMIAGQPAVAFGNTGTINFGQRPWQIPPADGFLPLQTDNLPDADIRNGSTAFQVIIGPGQGADGTVVANQRAGNWSKDAYGTNSTTYDGNTELKQWLAPPNASQTFGPWRMFDGDLVDLSCKTGTGNAQTWIYWRPDPAITDVTQLTIHTSNAQTVRINGGPATGQTSGGTADTYPIEIADPPETLTEIAIQGNTISSATVMGITINNEVLIDNNILNQCQTAFPNGLWWIKSFDANNVEGPTGQNQLCDNTRTVTDADGAIGYPFDGLTDITNGATHAYEEPPGNCFAWCWSAPTAWNDDSILANSGFRNTDAGFSMFQYQGNATRGHEVAHGLSRAPEFFFVQCITNTANFTPRGATYHHLLGPGGSANNTPLPATNPNVDYCLEIELNRAVRGPDQGFWDSTAPNATVITLGENSPMNAAGGTTANAPTPTIYQCYAWHSVPGYSQFGRYAADNPTQVTTADGIFVYTGFTPEAIWIKGTGAAETWVMRDGGKNPFNPVTSNSSPNQAAAVRTSDFEIDFLASGFKIRNGDGVMNYNDSAPYIYACWGSHPFGGANVFPVTAR